MVDGGWWIVDCGKNTDCTDITDINHGFIRFFDKGFFQMMCLLLFEELLRASS